MPEIEEKEDIHSMERSDTSKKLPIAWVILFVGLILWGVYYYIAYTPSISGWTQYDALEETLEQK